MKKDDYQYDCEVLLWFMVGGNREQRWIEREVKLVLDGASVRCKRCKATVRIHRQRIADGPRDHVEHMYRSQGCRATAF